jgi:hypothetical protein
MGRPGGPILPGQIDADDPGGADGDRRPRAAAAEPQRGPVALEGRATAGTVGQLTLLTGQDL